jgi:hypothetical protein
MKKNNLKYILMCFVVFVGFWPQNAVATMLVVTPMKPECKETKLTISQSKLLAKRYAKMKVKLQGWNDREWKSLLTLWSKESRWDYTADNPKSTAYGIPQILGMSEDTTPTQQVDLGLKYIKKRYKTPTLALQHHLRKGWY